MLGMTETELVRAVGEPRRVNNTLTGSSLQRQLVNASTEDTVYLDLFDGGFPPNSPHRVL
jgi:hypothetical protein